MTTHHLDHTHLTETDRSTIGQALMIQYIEETKYLNMHEGDAGFWLRRIGHISDAYEHFFGIKIQRII